MQAAFPTSRRPANSSFAEACEFALQIDPARHYLLPPDSWIEALQHHTGNDRLFLYYHRTEHKYVLSAWVYAPGEEGCDTGYCIEIALYDTLPALARIPIPIAAAECVPTEKALTAAINAKRDAASAALKKNEDSNAARDDIIKYMRQNGMEDEARLARTGHLPLATEVDVGAEAYRESAERLKDLAKITGSTSIIADHNPAEWGTKE